MNEAGLQQQRSDLDLARAAPDDLDAFAELVRRHQDFVYGAVLRVVRNHAVAEELAQETFLRAFRAIADFRGEAQVRSWLYRIATNLAVNWVTRRREFPTEAIPERTVAAGPGAIVERAELWEQLEAAIRELSDELRRPLVLREFEGMSYREIAEVTGLPLNTVRTRILRARRAVRKRLESWR